MKPSDSASKSKRMLDLGEHTTTACARNNQLGKQSPVVETSPAQTRAHHTYTRTSILFRAQSLTDSHMHKLSSTLALVTHMSKLRTTISRTLPIPRHASSRHSHGISAHTGAWRLPDYADAFRRPSCRVLDRACTRKHRRTCAFEASDKTCKARRRSFART